MNNKNKTTIKFYCTVDINLLKESHAYEIISFMHGFIL